MAVLGALRGPLLHPSHVSAKAAEAQRWEGTGPGSQNQVLTEGLPWPRLSKAPGCLPEQHCFMWVSSDWAADSWSPVKRAERPRSST